MLDIEDLRVFVEIAHLESFTRAAQALRMPKSSVARRLARLEEKIGRQLVARSTRVVTLTEDGELFLPHARRLLDDSIEARNVFSAGAEIARGYLTMTAPSTFGRAFIAPLLPRFQQRHPNIRVALRLSPAKLELGEVVDIAIRLGPLVEAGLGVGRLGEIDYVLVASPGYLSSTAKIEEPIDLSHTNFVELRPPAADNRIELHREGKAQTVRLVPNIEVNDPEAAKAIVLAGGGVAALPSFLVADDIAAKRLSSC